MTPREKFYKLSNKVLYFIHLYRLRYIYLDDLKREFEWILTDEQLINIINHLSNKDYIYITDDSNTSIKKIKEFSGKAKIRLTLKGFKRIYSVISR